MVSGVLLIDPKRQKCSRTSIGGKRDPEHCRNECSTIPADDDDDDDEDEQDHRQRAMALFSTVLGFSLTGLAARFGQLGIQKRNLFESKNS